MGKNQEKRKAKSIAHAKMVWTNRQLQAAQAMKSLDEAYETIQQNSGELTEEQIAQIDMEVARRKDEVKAFLLKARDNFISVAGGEDADIARDVL